MFQRLRGEKRARAKQALAVEEVWKRVLQASQSSPLRSGLERRRGKQMHSRSRGALPRPAARIHAGSACVATLQVQQVWRRCREMAQRRMRAACELSLSDWHSGSLWSRFNFASQVLLLQFFVRRWRRKRQLAARKIQARWLTAQNL